MLYAPPAGAATEMPLPASVVNAAPAVTQLLTSGAALNASSRYTACGPPAKNATGMSRPIAADGTCRYSMGGSAFASAAVQRHRASATTSTMRSAPMLSFAVSRSVRISLRFKGFPPSAAQRGHAGWPYTATTTVRSRLFADHTPISELAQFDMIAMSTGS